MDAEIFSGPNLAFVGISTVFVALLLMFVAITLMKRIVAPDADGATDGTPAASQAANSAGGDSADDNEEDTLRSVALAVYAFHASKSVRVPTAAGSSPWQRAGRASQVATRRPRS